MTSSRNLRASLNARRSSLLAADVRQHAAAVRRVERLDHDGPAELLARSRRRRPRPRDVALRHGDAVVAEEPLGQALVAGDLDAELPGRRGDRGLDALLVDARAEHDERAVVQAEVRDAARRRAATIDRVDGPSAQRSRGALQLVDRGSQIEVDLEPRAVLDDVEGELAGADADALLLHLVDEVVDAGRLRLARAAEGDGDADLLLDLDRHVLGHVAEPRPLGAARFRKPPGAPSEQWCSWRPGRSFWSSSREPADRARRASR